MSLTNDYLRYLAELCAGSRPAPEGIALTETDDMKRALQLQEAVGKMGLTAFLKACAAQDGVCYTQQELDSFDEQALMKTIAQLAAQETQPETDVAGQTPVRSEIREIYEVFLDSVLLDDALLRYLIDICRRHDEKEFRTLSHAAARTLLDLDDFMAWLGSKELFAGEDERACVRILDACFARLQAEGKLELLAALLSGDEKTFLLFRTQAPDLRQLPAATYEWFTQNYVDKYYPVRFLMRFNGVEFPQAKEAM